MIEQAKQIEIICLFLSTAIHIVAHIFNVEFFVDSHKSKDELIQRLNLYEDIGNEAYLNPIRNNNAVSCKFNRLGAAIIARSSMFCMLLMSFASVLMVIAL